jgi:hypothetical protein
MCPVIDSSPLDTELGSLMTTECTSAINILWQSQLGEMDSKCHRNQLQSKQITWCPQNKHGTPKGDAWAQEQPGF